MRRTIPEQIAANKRLSFFYALLVVLVLVGLVTAIVGAYSPKYVALGAVGGAALGLILAVFAIYSGSDVLLSVSGAREATVDEDRVLRNVAEEMSIAAGIPVPKVYVIDDSAPNAFAAGPDPQHAVVVFTTGIIQKLDRDELQGVMAHEISHIRNYDIRFMTTLALVAGAIPLIADAFRTSVWWGGGPRRDRDRDDSGQAIWMIVALVLSIAAPLFAKLLELAVSRQREFLADASAAELTRYPEGLARALIKISQDAEPLESANRATQHMFIVNPIKSWEAKAESMFDTHPPVEERVNRLRSLMGAWSTGLES